MALFKKAGNILRQTVSKNINQEISASSPSIFQMIRCMSTSKVFVGGLAYSTDDTSLGEAFNKYGEVAEARVIVDRETGRSRGFGFVTYTNPEDASAAIQALDGQDLHGRMVRVNYANDRARGTGFGGGGGYGGGGYGGNYGGGGYRGGNNFAASNDSNTGGYGGNTFGASNEGYDGNTSLGHGGENQFGSSGSSNMADADGDYTQVGQLEGNFRDDDNEPDDYANRRA